MIAQFVREIVKGLSEARQVRQVRRVHVWLLPFDEALVFFARKGVGLNGVTTQQQLNEALQGHLRMLQDARTVGNERLEAQIISYLKIRGWYRV